MDIHKLVNIVCLVLGIAVIVFGLIVSAGMLATVPSHKGLVPIVLGAVIILWALLSMRRHR